MFVSKNLGCNEQGHLTIGGVDTVALAKEYQTPLYVMDEDLIREHMRAFAESMTRYYDGHGMVCYASKAFSCKEIYRIADSEGLGVDVVSLGELETAKSVNFPAERICYHGNNKTRAELEAVIDYGVAYLVADNLSELHLIEEIALTKNRVVPILLRVSPGVEAHTHEFIKTGQNDSKFGFSIELGVAEQVIRQAVSLPHIKLIGVHAHIGSQIFDIAPFELAGDILIRFLHRMNEETGCQMNTLNLGGGFGISYTDADSPVPYQDYMERVSQKIKQRAAELSMPMPYIMIEPGRSIVGPAGITLYTVGGVKQVPGIRKYLSVDGGMTDNIRYALYRSAYDFVLANHANAPKDDVVTVAGRCCESGDLLGEHIALQTAKPLDLLAVCATGAYNYSMANHYNRTPKPAVVMVRGGESRVVVRRETVEDLLSCDV